MLVALAHVLWDVLQGSQSGAVPQHSGGQQRRCIVAGAAGSSAARCSWRTSASASWRRRLGPTTPPSGPPSQQTPLPLPQWQDASGADAIAAAAIHPSKLNPVCSQYSTADASRVLEQEAGGWSVPGPATPQRRSGGWNPEPSGPPPPPPPDDGSAGGWAQPQQAAAGGPERGHTQCWEVMRRCGHSPPLPEESESVPPSLRSPSPDMTLRYLHSHGLRYGADKIKQSSVGEHRELELIWGCAAVPPPPPPELPHGQQPRRPSSAGSKRAPIKQEGLAVKRDAEQVKLDPFGLVKMEGGGQAPLQSQSRAAAKPGLQRPGGSLGFGASAKRAPLRTTVAAFQMDSDEDD